MSFIRDELLEEIRNDGAIVYSQFSQCGYKFGTLIHTLEAFLFDEKQSVNFQNMLWIHLYLNKP